MADELITKIIEACLYIDAIAYRLYKIFQSVSKDETHKSFWTQMIEDEKKHISFWKSLLNESKQGLIPQIFDNPEKIFKELNDIKETVEKDLLENYEDKEISFLFTTAYRIEFFLLHSSFELLFHYSKLFYKTIKSPEDTYDGHINKFINALNSFGNVTPELELLGKTLLILWKDNKKLVQLSSIDELTGILNRRGFYNGIKPLSYFSSRNNETVGVMMIDIDFFKKINDIHGHAAGDIVLKQVAAILKENIRKSDIVARYGGEEFVIFLPSTDAELIINLGEKIREKVEIETQKNIAATISVGISYGALGENAEKDVIKHIINADDCLYEAKEKGRNKVIIKELVFV